jgi:quinol monooxygenase YgiN
MIVISAIITVAEGKGDEYQQFFKELAPKVRSDPGAITYVLHRNIKDPNEFFVFEQYEDEKAIEYHTSTDHFKTYREATADLVVDRRIGLYHEVA